MTGSFDSAAEELRRSEFGRLFAAMAPTLESLRALSGQQLRGRVALMLEQFGHEVLTPETAPQLLTMKAGRKYIVAFGLTTDPAPIGVNSLTRFHSLIVDNNATAGFFITTRGFTRDAETFAKTAPLKLVDGPKLVASMKQGMEGTPPPNTYKAMCRQCGAIVTHKLDHAEAVSCSNGHSVPPTIARAALVIQHQEEDRQAPPIRRSANTRAGKSTRTTADMPPG